MGTLHRMPTITIATAKGSRLHQEDRWVSKSIALQKIRHGRGQLLGVMDGHGGISAAETVKLHLEYVFSDSLRTNRGDIDRALLGTVKRLSEITSEDESGTTLSMAYIPSDVKRVHVAVVGDSPVVVQGGNHKTYIGPLHNVRCNPPELKSAFAKGARYYRGYIFDPKDSTRGLQMSRALGDCHMARILNRKAELFTVSLGTGSYVVLGTDGLFDPFDIRLNPILDAIDAGRNAGELIKDALRHKGDDNMTVILWRYPSRDSSDE